MSAAAGARILTNLVALGSDYAGPSGFQVGSGEYVASSVTSMGADGLAIFWQRGVTPVADRAVRKLYPGESVLVKRRGFNAGEWVRREPPSAEREESTKAIRRAETAGCLILWTLTIVEVLELTAGFGPPCEGDELKQSSRQFAALSGQLMVALPDDGWQGGAAQVYAEADITLGTIAQRMAELDGQVGALIHDQADWVTHIRLGFGILKDLLLAAFFAWTAMMATSNPTAARVFANTVCALGISIAVGMLVTLGYYSYENGQQADGLAGQYGQLAQEPVSGGAVVQAKVAAPAEESSVVSSFEGDSAGMAMTSATSEGSAAASGSDGSADQRAAVGGVRGAGQAAVEDVAAVAPTVSMPTLAEVSAWSGRAATVSGHASQHVNLVNQTMGSVQQRHIREPAGPAGASPAEETAGDGAGVGTQTGQRAPLEVAALDIRDTPDPHPLGRLA